jgi:small subunit ribosomal protein S1
MVLEIDIEKRRVSLGLKQCKENPWLTFSEKNSLGDVVKGEVRSITDFGMFIGLDGNIDGLVHLSDLSWSLSEEEAVKGYSKGQEVESVILGIDPHKERISLGIKQLSEDVFDSFAQNNPKGTKLTGTVSSIGEDNIFISLSDEVTGKIKLKEFKENTPSDGESVTSLVTSIDRKNRQINLSVFALEKAEEKEILKENISKNKQIESETKTSIGDLIQDEIEDSSKE